jgi:hypothetical protein
VFPGEWDTSLGTVVEGYVFHTARLGWVNVDQFYASATSFAPVCISLAPTFSDTSAVAFMVMGGTRTAVPLKWNAGMKKFCEPYQTTPIDAEIKIVVIGVDENGEWFLGKKSEKVVGPIDGHVEMKPITKENLQGFLKEL